MVRKTLDEVVLGNHPELHARYKKFLDPTRIMARHTEGASLEEVNMQHNVWAVLQNAKILAKEAGLPVQKLLAKGNVYNKMNIQAEFATPNAIKKTEEKGGKVTLQEKNV